MSTVLALDTMSLIHRSYHAARIGLQDNEVPVDPHRMHSTFCGLIRRAVDMTSPQFLLAAADTPQPTFRHRIDPTYKAGRKAPNADFVANLERTLEGMRRAGIPVISAAGWEADDILAALAARMRGGHRLVLVSSDRDLVALVSGPVQLFLLGHGGNHRLLGAADADSVFGVEASRICEYKALVGDSSDNITGVRGIGPKTAVRLLGDYPNLDSLRNGLGDLPRGLSDKLRDGWNDLERSLRLATLDGGAPVEFDARSARYHPERLAALARDVGADQPADESTLMGLLGYHA